MRSLNTADSNWVEAVRGSEQFVEITPDHRIAINLRYAGKNNFLGEELYPIGAVCFLHLEAAACLSLAAKLLHKSYPEYRFLILDALRPRRVQRKMWAAVEGTKQDIYVAQPERGSIHNFGFAVDLTLIDQKGVEVDMGTQFDDFQPLSQPQLEEEFLASGQLKLSQVTNRNILREVMVKSGFRGIPHEWWHFEAKDRQLVRLENEIVE